MYLIETTETWFNAYVDSFRINGELAPMLELKRKHSRRVQKLASAIAEALEWSEPHDAWTAHAVGLLHDTARFSQYRDFETFQDSASFDHGERGAEILEKEFDWLGIEESEKNKVLTAVRWHNKIAIPPELPLSSYKWAALARDADKIDVFRMVQYRIENGTIYDMLPRHKKVSGLSPALVDEIRTTGLGSYANARSLQDYRLIQLTWALDLNFPVSVVTLKDEGIFQKIADDLRQYGIDDLLDLLMEKIDKI
ncbi:MAG: HD domain-containing protein [Cloacibacillus sp.]